MKVYRKKEKHTYYFISIIVAAAVFAVLSLVFSFYLEGPDNHLPLYNFFGIFYKDMFFAFIISHFSGIIIIGGHKLLKSKKSAGYIIKMILSAAALSVLGGWLAAYIGSIIAATDREISGKLLLMLTDIIIYIPVSLTFCLINEKKAERRKECDLKGENSINGETAVTVQAYSVRP